MRSRFLIAVTFFAAFAASCASSGHQATTGGNGASDNAPEVELVQSFSSADTMYMRGPISLEYQLIVHNKSHQAMLLTRLDLETVGSGAYAIHTGATPMNQSIRPDGTTTIKVAAWGQARGGYLTADEPVNIRGTAYFKTPDGATIRRVFTQVLGQTAR